MTEDPVAKRARVSANVAKMQAHGASDDEIEHYVRDVEGLSPVAPTPPLPRFAAESTAVTPRTPAAADEPGYGQRLVTHVLNAAQGIPGMRAVEAAFASGPRSGAMGSQVTPGLSFAQARDALDSMTAQIPTGTRRAERVMGSVATLPFLPANPTLAGAALGGADEALSADSESPVVRAVKTAAGAGVGAVAGLVGDKLIQGVGTGTRALFAQNPAANYLTRLAQRAATAKQLFGSALAEGHANGITEPVRAFLAEPEIAARVQALQGLDQFRNTPAESPEMIDALYKSLSDEAKQIQKGQAAADPSKPNTGRFRADNIGAIKGRLVSALKSPGQKPPLSLDVAPETYQVDPEITPGRDAVAGPVNGQALHEYTTPPNPTLSQALRNFGANRPNAVQGPSGPQFQLPAQPDMVRPGVEITTPAMRVQTAPAEAQAPMMPSYGNAVDDFARQSGDISALGRGMTASQAASGSARPTFKQITSKDSKTPQTLAEWAKTATPSQIRAATEGVLGDVSNAFHEPSKVFAPFRQAVSASGPTLRALGDRPQSVLDILKTSGLAALNSPFAP